MFEPAELKTPPTRAYLANQSTARCPRGASIKLPEKSDKKSLTLKGRSQPFLTAQDRSAASHQEELTRSKICPKFYWQIFFEKLVTARKSHMQLDGDIVWTSNGSGAALAARSSVINHSNNDVN